MKKILLFLRVDYFNRFYICLAALAILFGGIIYILFRSSKPIFFSWIGAVSLGSMADSFRHNTLSIGTLLPEWFIYSLPNGLWAFAYASIITGIWWGSANRLKYFWMISIPVLVAGYEILQYAGIIPGTFCMQDMILGMAGLIAGIWAGISTTKPKNHENTFE